MSIAPRSPYRKVQNAFLRGDVYAILTRPNIIRKDPHYTFALIEADKDDNKFVDCAIAANAKCIVTEDKHFKVLENIPFPKVEVIGIEDFKCYLDKWIQVYVQVCLLLQKVAEGTRLGAISPV